VVRAWRDPWTSNHPPCAVRAHTTCNSRPLNRAFSALDGCTKGRRRMRADPATVSGSRPTTKDSPNFSVTLTWPHRGRKPRAGAGRPDQAPLGHTWSAGPGPPRQALWALGGATRCDRLTLSCCSAGTSRAQSFAGGPVDLSAIRRDGRREGRQIGRSVRSTRSLAGDSAVRCAEAPSGTTLFCRAVLCWSVRRGSAVMHLVRETARSRAPSPLYYRRGRNAARISLAKSSGSSHAAKWPPLSTSL
jgi:hypothetical protein